MAENIASGETELEAVAAVAMQMVIHAGDARNLVMEALDAAGESDYDMVTAKLAEAQEELRQAHIFQTEIVQSEAAGKKYQYSLLFTHAQDTVMTICSELNMAKKMIALYKKTDERFAKLESRIGSE